MPKHSLAIVCALAFALGGASAFVLEYPSRGNDGVHDAAEIGRGAEGASGAAETSPEQPVRPEEAAAATDGGHDFAPRPEDRGVEAPQTDGTAARAGKPFVGVKGRGSAVVRTVEGRRAGRGYARAQSGGAPSQGRGIASYTVGGMKKTGGGMKKAGVAIGKTFGKIGGVFHD